MKLTFQSRRSTLLFKLNGAAIPTSLFIFDKIKLWLQDFLQF